MNGEHAGAATEGKPGQTVHVSLSRSPDAFAGHPPGYIVVTIDKHAHQCIVPKPHTREIEECVHDLGHDGAILLSACGGDGGVGGTGGHGQGGGHGRHGTDANLQMSGTNGEGGGNGGFPVLSALFIVFLLYTTSLYVMLWTWMLCFVGV